jgi:hypothetical protein
MDSQTPACWEPAGDIGRGARVPQPAGDGCHGRGISARVRGLEFLLSSFPNVGRNDALPVEGSAPTIWSQAMSAKKGTRRLSRPTGIRHGEAHRLAPERLNCHQNIRRTAFEIGRGFRPHSIAFIHFLPRMASGEAQSPRVFSMLEDRKMCPRRSVNSESAIASGVIRCVLSIRIKFENQIASFTIKL